MASRSGAVESGIHSALTVAVDSGGGLNGILPAVPTVQLTDEIGSNIPTIKTGHLIQVGPGGWITRKDTRNSSERDYGVMVLLFHKPSRTTSGVVSRSETDMSKEFIENLVTWFENPENKTISGTNFRRVEPSATDEMFSEALMQKGVFAAGVVGFFYERIKY